MLKQVLEASLSISSVFSIKCFYSLIQKKFFTINISLKPEYLTPYSNYISEVLPYLKLGKVSLQFVAELIFKPHRPYNTSNIKQESISRKGKYKK